MQNLFAKFPYKKCDGGRWERMGNYGWTYEWLLITD